MPYPMATHTPLTSPWVNHDRGISVGVTDASQKTRLIANPDHAGRASSHH